MSGQFPRAKGQEVAILVGLPGSGKTTFRSRYLQGYSVLSKDERPGAERQARELLELLRAGKSVVVDNTNASEEERAPLLRAAREVKVPVRAVVLDTPEAEARRRNVGRPKADQAPPVAMNVVKKRLRMPTRGEGFAAIVRATPSGGDFSFWEAG